MPNLRKQFEQALTNIEVNGQKRKRAIDAHTEIRELLQQDKQLRDWGIEPLLIGSFRPGSEPLPLARRAWASGSSSPPCLAEPGR